MVPITTVLSNTDIVEIITSKNSKGPSRDWLKYVKTSSAKSKISSFLKKQGREINVQIGKEIFEKYLKKQKLPKEELLNEKYIEEMLKKISLKTIEDCYENIGFGSISPLKVMNKLNEAYKKDNTDILSNTINKSGNSKNKSNIDLVIVENISNCKVQFAKCCNPIPGDEIIGYITNSNGVSIHTLECNNISKLDDTSRKIKVSWAKTDISSFTAKIIVKANNRNNILTDVIGKLNELKVNITEMNTKTTQDKENIMEFTLNITNVNELQKTIKNIKKVDSVFEVKRAR
jgi:GTP pyrophosphokinase